MLERVIQWVSLLLWAGADPRWIVPDLEYDPPNENLGSALEDAVKYSRIEIVKKIGIDPARDNPSALLGECWMCRSPELVRLLIEAGADPNSQEGEWNAMQSLVRNFEWSLDSSFGEIEDRCKVLFEPHPNSHATKISAKPRSAHSLSEATGRAAANPFPGLIRPPNFDLEGLRKPLKSRRR